MLVRMYLRWCARRGFEHEWIYDSPGEGSGFREAAFLIRDARASEWLAAESGTHRIVRVSPFGDSPRMTPALATVEVTPDPGGEVDAVLRDGDLDYELPKQRQGM